MNVRKLNVSIPSRRVGNLVSRDVTPTWNTVSIPSRRVGNLLACRGNSTASTVSIPSRRVGNKLHQISCDNSPHVSIPSRRVGNFNLRKTTPFLIKFQSPQGGSETGPTGAEYPLELLFQSPQGGSETCSKIEREESSVAVSIPSRRVGNGHTKTVEIPLDRGFNPLKAGRKPGRSDSHPNGVPQFQSPQGGSETQALELQKH